MKTLVRRIIGPVVRWAADGFVPNFYSIRGPGGAYLCLVDCFGVVYQKPLGIFEARNLADDLMDNSYRAAEGMPLLPDDQ